MIEWLGLHATILYASIPFCFHYFAGSFAAFNSIQLNLTISKSYVVKLPATVHNATAACVAIERAEVVMNTEYPFPIRDAFSYHIRKTTITNKSYGNNLTKLK